MFGKNEEHRQQSFFSGHYLLPDKRQEGLLTSRAETFYQELFCRIDEESRGISKPRAAPLRPKRVWWGRGQGGWAGVAWGGGDGVAVGFEPLNE